VSEVSTQLPLFWGEHGGPEARPSARNEARGGGDRVVEYCPFPRVSAAQGWRMGFARRLSAEALCLEADQGFGIGSLLHITLRSIDGRPTLDTLARVVWCHAAPSGAELGLALLDCAPGAEHAPVGVRPARARALRRIA